MKKLLSLKTDIVFKMLFENHLEILADLIDSVLARPEGRRIESVVVKNPGVLPEEIGKKFIVLDIRAQDESGEQFDIEMQVRKYPSYSKRSLFYLCKVYVEQLSAGEDYAELKPVTGIHFLDYEMFPELPDFHFRFAFLESRHPEICLTEDIVLHVVELPAFERAISGKAGGSFEEWVRFLNRADLETEESMREQYANPKIHKAYDALKTLSENEQARLHAEMRERALKNEVSELNAARREGERRGAVDSICKVLEFRFGRIPESTRKRFVEIGEIETLQSLLEKALVSDSLEEFEKNVPRI